jgi:hypothetical protein
MEAVGFSATIRDRFMKQNAVKKETKITLTLQGITNPFAIKVIASYD